ncbi:MAG: hypothetical protein DSY85_01950 [Marinomonas sp.]|nr:MAG: hypothetical protein DSY85_01950 [Marinomonas sp.]
MSLNRHKLVILYFQMTLLLICIYFDLHFDNSTETKKEQPIGCSREGNLVLLYGLETVVNA